MMPSFCPADGLFRACILTCIKAVGEQELLPPRPKQPTASPPPAPYLLTTTTTAPSTCPEPRVYGRIPRGPSHRHGAARRFGQAADAARGNRRVLVQVHHQDPWQRCAVPRRPVLMPKLTITSYHGRPSEQARQQSRPQQREREMYLYHHPGILRRRGGYVPRQGRENHQGVPSHQQKVS
jgi:hypothetical protein